MAVLIGLPAGVYFLLYDHQNEPLCHKGIMLALLNWLDQKQTDVLPNVEGRSVDSLAQLHAYWGDDPWEEKYCYIPGLRKGDPGDLVLMYMPVPTRYIWHDNPQTIFAESKWMILPLDFWGQTVLKSVRQRRAIFPRRVKKASAFRWTNSKRG